MKTILISTHISNELLHQQEMQTNQPHFIFLWFMVQKLDFAVLTEGGMKNRQAIRLIALPSLNKIKSECEI